MSLYKTLGVEPSSTAEQIKRAYKRQAGKYHPDKNSDPKAKAKFQEVQEAYKLLSDDKRRHRYDETGETEEVESLETQAHGIIAGVFSQLLEAEKYMARNYLVDITKYIQNLYRQLCKAEKETEALLNKASYLMENSKGDALIATLESKKRDINHELSTVKERIEIAKIALEILADYEYNGTTPQPKSQFTGHPSWATADPYI